MMCNDNYTQARSFSNEKHFLYIRSFDTVYDFVDISLSYVLGFPYQIYGFGTSEDT